MLLACRKKWSRPF